MLSSMNLKLNKKTHHNDGLLSIKQNYKLN